MAFLKKLGVGVLTRSAVPPMSSVVPAVRFFNSSGNDNPFSKHLQADRYVGFKQEVKEDGVHAWFDLPGIKRENVKVLVKKNHFMVKFKEGDDEPYYEEEFVFHDTLRYKLAELKAEMKGGILKIVVPGVDDVGQVLYEAFQVWMKEKEKEKERAEEKENA